jgi:hypothetical protein
VGVAVPGSDANSDARSLGVPIVNFDDQALARWSAFFLATWEDIKLWRERPEYQMLKQDILL